MDGRLSQASPRFPRTIKDIEKGSDQPGDCQSSPYQTPSWLDKAKFRRGQDFFKSHFLALFLSLHCSLTTGFSIINLLEPLVFTEKSDTPPKALSRYRQTFLHLMNWFCNEIWEDTEGVGFKSIQTVRKMHRFVGNAMTKKMADTGRVYISQYDMGLVQCGFMGAIVMYPKGFGVHCHKSDLEDYIHFWRGIGYLLGIDDKYNICAGNYAETFAICKEIEQEKLLPGLENHPNNFSKMVNAYIDGINIPPGFQLHSFNAILAFVFDGMGVPVPKLSWTDTLRLWIYKCLVFMIRWCPGFEWLTNKLMYAVYEKEKHTVDLEAKQYS